MIRNIFTRKFYILILTVTAIQIACVNQPEKKKAFQAEPVADYKKPGSNYQDSIQIAVPAAVFYYPDTLQLQKIKESMDSIFYDGTMHDFFYQIRNARMVIKKTWPELKIIDAKNCRYLVFHRTGKAKTVIDLNTLNDTYGLYIYDQVKSPLFVDMTNIETQVSFYLKE